MPLDTVNSYNSGKLVYKTGPEMDPGLDVVIGQAQKGNWVSLVYLFGRSGVGERICDLLELDLKLDPVINWGQKHSHKRISAQILGQPGQLESICSLTSFPDMRSCINS